MAGRRNCLPRRVECAILQLVLLLAPASAIAQDEPGVSTDAPAGGAAAQASGGKSGSDILNLDIEQLARTPVVVPSMDIPVTSVTKEQSTVGRSAAAVFVITNEMIRRSGVTSIPEALRMAPGVEVAQINSNTWAISCRGFNNLYANKLLVLIDGRSVYNPDFAGTLWDVQDVLLEDVERIEVVRGPGGTLWGANAVNGVINIITKKAKDTQGTYVTAGGGTHEKMLDGFRYGGQIGEDLQYRVYGKHFERGADFDPTGTASDAWRQGRFGFRVDWEPDRDESDVLTVQGDHYVGNTANSILSQLNPTSPEQQTGENVLLRWRQVYDEDSDWTLQAYYDKFSVTEPLLAETVKTLDIDFQYRFPLTDRHSITCGVGFRNVDSCFSGGDQFGDWCPSPYLTTNYTNEFVQDEIALIEDRLALTLGCKLEQNPFTGLEYQPNARLLWTPDRRHSAWGAISRAVRTPTRIDEQASITIPPIFPGVYPRYFGNSGLVSETAWSYEIGYRAQATDRFSWDLATFYSVYDNLIVPDYGIRPVPPPPPLIIPLVWQNLSSAETYGVELAGNYSVSERWRLQAQYTLFEINWGNNPIRYNEGSDPCNQIYLRSTWDLRDDLEFDLIARYVDSLNLPSVFQPTAIISNYITMDLRLAWRPREHLELAVVGQNLLQSHHLEDTGYNTLTTEAPRGVYGTLTWRR